MLLGIVSESMTLGRSCPGFLVFASRGYSTLFLFFPPPPPAPTTVSSSSFDLLAKPPSEASPRRSSLAHPCFHTVSGNGVEG